LVKVGTYKQKKVIKPVLSYESKKDYILLKSQTYFYYSVSILYIFKLIVISQLCVINIVFIIFGQVLESFSSLGKVNKMSISWYY